MNAKIHASVAVGERRSSSSVAQATSTQRKYDPTKISNHGTCMRAGYLASLAERIARHWDAEIVAELRPQVTSQVVFIIGIPHVRVVKENFSTAIQIEPCAVGIAEVVNRHGVHVL